MSHCITNYLSTVDQIITNKVLSTCFVYLYRLLGKAKMTEKSELVPDKMVSSPDSPSFHLFRESSEETEMPNPKTDEPCIIVKFDPSKTLQRSQSDVILLQNKKMKQISSQVQILDVDGCMEGNPKGKGPQNISEMSCVYADLSKGQMYDPTTGKDSDIKSFSSTRKLEPILQEDVEDDSKNPFSAENPFMEYTRSEMNELTGSIGKPWEKTQSVNMLNGSAEDSDVEPLLTGSQSSPRTSKLKSGLKTSYQAYSQTMKHKIKHLVTGKAENQLKAVHEINVLMEQAWALPIHGRDLAYGLSDMIRSEGALEIIVKNCASTERDIMRASAKLLEQILTTGNRHKVSKTGLEIVVKMANDAKGEFEMARITTGILESLFKTSEETCTKVIELGGLDTIISWCRFSDKPTLRHCSIAFANLALYGGAENQEVMTKHKAPEWLFPLAFSADESVRYYAILAISVLVSNKHIEQAVLNSGTLDLVLPFINKHMPSEFAQMDISHLHGRSQGWLKRLIPLLSSKREEAQALAAFHFTMEAGIKAEQGRLQIFYDIGSIPPLRRLAGSPNSTASKLAAEALKIIGEDIPHKLSQQVPLWTVTDVVHWLEQIGFSEYISNFRDCKVDGDLLLRLSQEELVDSLHIECAIARKRFNRELDNLKVTADYSSCDPSNLDDWLIEICPLFSQYTYKLIQVGIDRYVLPHVTDFNLRSDCNITNGIHRLKIMQRINAMKSGKIWRDDSIDGSLNRNTDVFISYRRSNGSQLASLLKVHLQLKGFTVFLDIEKLPAGKFDESLLSSVKLARNFILVLTPNSLDRCIDDREKKDWVHKEIVAALEANCNIIPLMDHFEWPSPDQLPEDMRNISYFNGIKWIHDYQDACVEKVERFLRGEVNTRSSNRGCLQAMSSLGSLDNPKFCPRWSSIDTGSSGESSNSSPSDGVS